jgi:hypothetical protein
MLNGRKNVLCLMSLVLNRRSFVLDWTRNVLR